VAGASGHQGEACGRGRNLVLSSLTPCDRRRLNEEGTEGGGGGRQRCRSREVAMALRCDTLMSWAQWGGVSERTRWGREKEKGNKIFSMTLEAHRG
jgi:hypothetical protein